MFEKRIAQLLKRSKENHLNDAYVFIFLQNEFKKLDKTHNCCEIPNLFNMDFLQNKLSEINPGIIAVPTERNTVKISI